MLDRRWSSLITVGFAYVAALLVASAVVDVLRGWPPLGRLAAADLAATVAVFVFSRAFDNSSVYDPYWSVAPIPMAAFLALDAPGSRALDLRTMVVLALVTAYGVRLTQNWVQGWGGLTHEDWRYVDLRAKTGALYWPVSFLGIHLVPTIVVYLGCLPLFPVLGSTSPPPFGILDGLATVVTSGAIVIEALADRQLRAFRRQPHGAGDICEVGLWRYSRHPNYFGEISFWVGLWLFGLSCGGPWWMLLGPTSMVALFLAVSIPLAERRTLARRPHFAEHQRRVSRLIPWVPRRSSPPS